MNGFIFYSYPCTPHTYMQSQTCMPSSSYQCILTVYEGTWMFLTLQAFPREKHCLQFHPPMVFLLLILVTQSEAYCPRNNPHDTCFLLQESLKTALLNSSQNLYNLKEEFFPSSHSSPVFGYVNYTIRLDKPFSGYEPHCQPYPSDLPYTSVLFNDSKYPFIWTDSALLSKIDPFILSYYQLEILSVMYSQVGILDYRFYPYPPRPEYLTVNLTLLVESLPCIPTEGQLLDILTDLTSWVSNSYCLYLF